MPALNETSYTQRIDTLKEDLSAENQCMPHSLNEKGVECSLVIPLFETLLGFDAMKDIQYEYSSSKKFERFDFLVDGRFIVEAKKLNAPLGKQIHKQIIKYISHHDEINYGILSNGSDYAFFLQKTFIKEHLGPEEKLKINFDREVFHVLNVSIFNSEFFDVMRLFSKDTYHEIFSRIARFVLTRINCTRATKIADDKKLNAWLQKEIEATIDIKHGVYLKDIESGKMEIGQKLQYKNGFVEITVSVLNDGRVLLSAGDAKITDLMQAMDSEFSPMIDLVREEWRETDSVFTSTDEMIKEATNRERLIRNKYNFVAI